MIYLVTYAEIFSRIVLYASGVPMMSLWLRCRVHILWQLNLLAIHILRKCAKPRLRELSAQPCHILFKIYRQRAFLVVKGHITAFGGSLFGV